MSGPQLTRREVALAALAAAGIGGVAWRWWDEQATLAAFDPELRAFVRSTLDHPPPDLTAANLTMFRRIEASGAPPPLPGPAATRMKVSGVEIEVINARRGGNRPAIFYLHGGGFVMGNASGAVRQLQQLCTALDCVAVAVDYRLAPETGHAAMLGDCGAALRWVHDQAATIGVDPARIAIMGASAGGALATLLAMRARDEGVVKPCLQFLLYPMLDDRTITDPPAIPSLWSAANNRFGWASFLGEAPSAGAVPARRVDVASLPPSYIAVGSCDLFLDEDVRFARRLRDAGVPTQIDIIPGAFHGFDRAVPQSGVARRFRARTTEILARAFAAPAHTNH